MNGFGEIYHTADVRTYLAYHVFGKISFFTFTSINMKYMHLEENPCLIQALIN